MGSVDIGHMNAGLGTGFLSGLRRSAGLESSAASVEKGLSLLDHARLTLALKHAEELFVESIGRGIHRPYKVRLKTAERAGLIDCSEVVFKTVHSQYETKKYCQSVDLKITGPEREVLAYDLDKVMGFNLVPPVVGRHVDRLGYGSAMAWVRAPLAIDWVKGGAYQYRKHPENPWLHKCAAFDFITGQLDRHAANWILDSTTRVYAIDNGYSFVRGDDRRFMKCNIGRHLVGQPVHPETRNLLLSVDLDEVWKTLQNRGFKSGEPEGVMHRLEEMQRLTTWGIMGGLWDPKTRRRS